MRPAATDASAPLLLFPGAGSSREHPSLLAIERAVAPRVCRRIDFPYRLAGRRAPDRAPVLCAAVHDAAVAIGAPAVVLGGRSMGGRMCSMVVADPPDTMPRVVGLVLVAYPLHPPRRPDRLRVEHLGRITAPCLFVSGTRDAFGSPEELCAATATMQAPVTQVWIDGAGHDLRGADEAVAGAVAAWLDEQTVGLTP